MLISYNWLKKYIDITLTPSALADTLNVAGLPIEEQINKKSPFSDVYIAKVLAVEKHSQADNLNICDVTDGTETLKIVCGAKNVAVGQTIALAKIGAILPGDFKIKKAKIRGIESNGMICSKSELGLAAESDGIMVLNEADFKLGSLYEPVIPDTIYNLEITPNRPDLLCVTGVARFIASRLGLKFNYPSLTIDATHIDSNLDINSKISITNQTLEKCPRYSARLIEGITIAESPQWLKDALSAVNIRSINNVVDVTNYVLFELNHPLHAFDTKKLKGSKIIIRTAQHGEKLMALDGKEYHPHAEDLVIADESNPAALAGIMGGTDYSVSETTTSIILESAYFLPKSVRKSSRRMGLSSDSSYRFERGIDINNVTNALNRAVELIIQVAGGKTSNNIIDIYPAVVPEVLIPIRFDKVNKILGTSFSADEISANSEKLFFSIKSKNETSITLSIPHYRVDITEEIDIIEDMAQIFGYNNIPITHPASIISIGKEDKKSVFKKELSTILTKYGFSEVVNYSFLNNKFLKSINAQAYLPEGSVAIKNPYNDEETHMKTSLLPDLIKNLITNINNDNTNIHLFETSNIFLSKGTEFLQLPRLGAITSGMIIDKSYNNKEFSSDFYYLKSVISSIASLLTLKDEVSYKMSGNNEFYEYFATVEIKGKKVGTIGQLKEEIIYSNKIKEKPCMFELDIDSLYSLYSGEIKYTTISRFPSVKRDISVVVKDDITQDKLEHIIKSDYKSLIKSLSLFDTYRGNQIPAGCKSLSYNIIFQSSNKTLSEAEISKAMERIISKLKSDLNAELRS